MSQIILNLPDKAAAELAEASRETNRNPEDVASELLQRALLLRRFDRAQEKISKSLRPDAPQSEEQAFDQIS
jgi:oligoendopeptidase F